MSTYKAWSYTGSYPDQFKKTEIAASQQSAESSLVLRISACALNPVDIQAMNLDPLKERGKERGIGCDFSGVVLSVPPGYNGAQAGDEVFGMTMSPFTVQRGALTEKAYLDAKATVLAPKPTNWSHVQAASIPLVWLTARTSIEAVAPYVDSNKPRVVILGGSSSTGSYSVLLAKRRGWTVLATSSAANQNFLTQNLRVDEHVDYTKENVRSRVAAFRPNAIIDCVGGTECIGVPGNKRYITIVGDKTSRSRMGGPFTYWDYQHPFFAAAQWIRWAKGRVGLGEKYDNIILDLNQAWLKESVNTLSTDKIFIDSTFPFDQADKAYERLNTGRAKGKVVVEVEP